MYIYIYIKSIDPKYLQDIPEIFPSASYTSLTI